MYLTRLKTVLTVALRETFDAEYVHPQFRGIHISIEYPEKRDNFPGVWVDFEPMGELIRAGIDHGEYRESEANPTRAVRFTRYRVQGNATYTVVALTSRERDALFDEVVRTFAFGSEHQSTKDYRRYIETNDLIAINMDFDSIAQRGFAASPGTPWNTDDIVYEATISMNLVGEFMSDNATGELLPISAIVVSPLVEGDSGDDPWEYPEEQDPELL
jgi:hypothetical protein